MRRQVVQHATTLAVGLFLSLGLTDGLWAHSQVNVQVNIGAPPPVVLRAQPTMVYLTEPAAYAAIGTPYDIFYAGDRYYYLHGDNWFWAPGYAGPWTYVTVNRLPPGLQKFKVVRLREFREREQKVYVVQGAKYKGKQFKGEEHGKGHGKKGK